MCSTINLTFNFKLIFFLCSTQIVLRNKVESETPEYSTITQKLRSYSHSSTRKSFWKEDFFFLFCSLFKLAEFYFWIRIDAFTLVIEIWFGSSADFLSDRILFFLREWAHFIAFFTFTLNSIFFLLYRYRSLLRIKKISLSP
jgi:hypothetical protein